jgi:hypothetical protein
MEDGWTEGLGRQSAPTTASHGVCRAQLLLQDGSSLQVLRGDGRERMPEHGSACLVLVSC